MNKTQLVNSDASQTSKCLHCTQLVDHITTLNTTCRSRHYTTHNLESLHYIQPVDFWSSHALQIFTLHTACRSLHYSQLVDPYTSHSLQIPTLHTTCTSHSLQIPTLPTACRSTAAASHYTTIQLRIPRVEGIPHDSLDQ